MLGAFKQFLPQPHCFKDEDTRYNVGLTWIDDRGLTDSHNLQIQYIRNCERWALEKGKPQPDGSWVFIEDNGCVHSITAEKAKHFMEKTQENANIMVAMLDLMPSAVTHGTQSRSDQQTTGKRLGHKHTQSEEPLTHTLTC